MAEANANVKFGAEGGEVVLTHIAQIREALQGLTNPLRALRGNLGEIAEGFLAAFAVERIAEWAERMAHLGAEVEHTSQMLGMSAEAVTEFQFAAGVMGVSSEAASMSLMRMERNLTMAAQGTGRAAAAFKSLGIEVTDSSGHLKNLDELLPEIAKKFSESADGPEKTAIAMDLMGRTGARMIPFLNQGIDGLERMKQVAAETGTVLSGEMVRGMEETEIKLYTLGKAWEGLSVSIYERVKPALDILYVGLTSILERITRLLNVTDNAKMQNFVSELQRIDEQLENLQKRKAGPGLFGHILGGGSDITAQTSDLMRKRDEIMAEMAKISAGDAADTKPKLATPDSSGGALGAYSQQLQKQLAVWNIGYQQREQYERQFWTTALGEAKSGTAEYSAIQYKLYEANQKAAQKADSEKKAGEQELTSFTKQQGEARLAQLKEALQEQVSAGKLSNDEMTRQVRDATYEVATANIAAIEKQRAELDKANAGYLMSYRKLTDEISGAWAKMYRDLESLQNKADDKNRKLAVEWSSFVDKQNMDQMTATKDRIQFELDEEGTANADKVAMLRALTDQIYQVNRSQTAARMEAAGEDKQAALKAYEELLKLDDEYAKQKLKLDEQASKNSGQWAKQGFDLITSSFDTMLNGVLMGTQTMSQAFKKMAADMALAFIEAIAKMMLQYTAFKALSMSGFGSAAKAIGNPFASGSGLGGMIGGLGGAGGGAAAGGAASAATQQLTTALHGSTAAVTQNTGGVLNWVSQQITSLGSWLGLTASTDADAVSTDAAAVSTGTNAVSTDGNTVAVGTLIAAIGSLEAAVWADVIAKAVSFDVGSWSVPHTMPALVHAGEMIIPPAASAMIRSGRAGLGIPQGGDGGGGAPGITVIVQAIDTQTGMQFVKSQAAAIADAVSGQIRNGNGTLKGAMRKS